MSRTTPSPKNHSSGSSSIVAAFFPGSAVVMPRGVDVRDVVGTEPGEFFDRPALAVAQQVRRDAEHGLDLGGPLGVARRISISTR